MAPSTAEPPCWSMLLEGRGERMFHYEGGGRGAEQSHLANIGLSRDKHTHAQECERRFSVSSRQEAVKSCQGQVGADT